MLLGIDLGTSSLKTILMDADGHICAQAAANYPIHTPHPGWAEQSPEDWVQAAIETTRHIVALMSGAKTSIQGIAFSGQMHGLVVVGKDAQPLRPAIIWADQRSSEQVDEVHTAIGREQLGNLTGNPLAAGFMLPSWLWLRQHEPAITNIAAWLLLPKDYLRLVLCGEIGTEPSDASSTGLFDPFHSSWQQVLCAALDIPADKLPPLFASAAVAGALRPVIAEQMGIPAGIPVVFGASDQAAQALANGVIGPETGSTTIGTGGQLFLPMRHPRHDPALRLHCFCHAVPHTWHLESAILSAGLSLRWLKESLLENHHSYQHLADTAADVAPGAEGLLFLPDLAGNRTPHMNPHSRGALIGLTLRHTPAHMARAVMEGVVMEMRQGLDIMTSLQGNPLRMVASGGGTRHPLWLQLQADIYNRPILRSQVHEAAAVGAAMLASIGTKLYQSVDEAVNRVVHWEQQPTLPDQGRVQSYQALYLRFCQVYPAIQHLNQ
jgi:xylulokinase